MESIHARNFKFATTKSLWKNVYHQKVCDIRIANIREFNYKLINNIIPSGYWLSKWKRDISEKCAICNQLETTQHMLFDCVRALGVCGTGCLLHLIVI